VRIVEHELLLPATVAVSIGSAIERITDTTELLAYEYSLDEANAEFANICGCTLKIAGRLR
jgi:hypothetical protein